ncbi:MAG: glycosyl transferase family 4 [Candidatus Pacearchaeota archaeon]|jgi:UDP-N-acetylglucosamine--dolichyl-phosphate N-acetylglucosaminephosphotransferase
MNLILGLSILVSFVVSVIALPHWIRKCKEVDLLWEDMNKYNHPRNVASSGGIIVITSFILGVLTYIAIKTFIIRGNTIELKIFSLLTVILILAIVGLVDDLLGWKKGGLSVRLRLLLAFAAAIPLIVINAGEPIIDIPLFGLMDIGLFYPLILIPLGIAGATFTYNMLAGFNGLESGQGIIILSFLSFVAYITGSSWLALIGLIMVVSLIVFYMYNKYPAKIFPGDILTYSIGALIAGMAILGNFEKIAVFIFIPYIMETFLKLRGKLKKQSFGIAQKDGSLKLPYDKIYGITHLSIFIISKFKKKVYEKDVVYLINAFQILLCLIALFVFRNTLFFK